MMQRKGVGRSFSSMSYFNGDGSVLPMTSEERSRPATKYRNRYRHDVNTGVLDFKLVRILGIVAGIGVVVIIFRSYFMGGQNSQQQPQQRSPADALGGGSTGHYWSTLDDQQKLPLEEFTSLQYALDHSDIVILYFAASWCRDSTPITNLLDEKFGEILLPPDDHLGDIDLESKRRAPISLIYVSSDESEQQMIEYTRKNWIDVPFHSTERTQLKRKFKVAAKRELEVLNMERQYELPTIVIVSGETHNVLTMHGVDDLKEKGSEALIYWMKLLHTVRSLEDKY